MKKTILISIILSFCLVLSGCFDKENKLYEAIDKTEETEQLETIIDMNFNLSLENFDDEKLTDIYQLPVILNNTDININLKQKQNEEKTSSQSYLDSNIKIFGMSMELDAWTDRILEDDNVNYKQVIKLPEIIGQMLNIDKEYVVYDLNTQVENQLKAEDIITLESFIKNQTYLSIMELENINLVTEDEKVLIDGEEHNVYKVNLSPEDFTQVAKILLNKAIEDEEVSKIIEKQSYKNYSLETLENLTREEILEKAKIELEKKLEKGFLGPKGISITYKTNKDNFIVIEEGLIDLKLDLSNVKNLNEDIIKKGILNLEISYVLKNYKIQDKEFKIQLPETNELNSLNYDDFKYKVENSNE